MVIDDDAISRKKLVRIFQRLRFEQIEEFGEGDKALTRLKEHPVDLVMADWHMPGLTGLEILKAIRQDPALSNTLVYLVTNEGRQAQIVSAIQAGASGYIMKPFSQNSIKEKLNNLLPQQPPEFSGIMPATNGNQPTDSSSSSDEQSKAPSMPTAEAPPPKAAP